MIGIRREDKNEWERRAPLTPDHVSELVKVRGIDIAVEPSIKRTFADLDYESAGARLSEDLAGSRVVLGVKEIPPEKLQPDTTYLFFSHTSKGQAYNMPLLRRMLDLRCTLLDYELVLDPRGRRLIFFGRYAGYAGMIDTLWALGRKFNAEGLPTPFERMRLAHDYTSLDEATHHVSRIGERLRHTGFPEPLRPIVFGFTGSGNVSLGAQEIFDRLPTLDVAPEELPGLLADPDRPWKVLYKVRFDREHRIERVGGGPVDLGELGEHPERYRSGMAQWLPHLTVLVHGAYWEPPQPRLVSNADLAMLWQSGPPRLRVITDVSCDIRGGIEATVKTTTPDNPVFTYDLARHGAVDGFIGNGPVILSVDNLPCQLPAESSEHFGDTLVGYIPALDRCAWERPFGELELPGELSRAIIAHRGSLTPRFARLRESLGAT